MKNTVRNEETKSEEKKERSFFKRMFSRKQVIKALEQSHESLCPTEGSFFDSVDELCPTFSYEDIIFGKVPLHELDTEKIEVNFCNICGILFFI